MQLPTEPLGWDSGTEWSGNPKKVLKELGRKQQEELQKKLQDKVVHGPYARYKCNSPTHKPALSSSDNTEN